MVNRKDEDTYEIRITVKVTLQYFLCVVNVLQVMNAE